VTREQSTAEILQAVNGSTLAGLAARSGQTDHRALPSTPAFLGRQGARG